MVINALEATDPGGTIKITTIINQKNVQWSVWSQNYIPETIQKRIFQKHFSTKSKKGRGIGTYSMKLFGENLLGGKVSFKSSEKNGTFFTFRLSY